MENSVQQLLDMTAVHRFYVALLQDKLGFAPPVPAGVQQLIGDQIDTTQPTGELAHWLSLLDLAITPLMVRDSLKVDSTAPETAEALFRYFYRKSSSEDSDRDKFDFVITFLFRRLNMRVRSADEWGEDGQSSFEEHICEIIGLSETPPLAEEHRQLLREFPFVRHEVEDISQFDKLMDSGIMQRVRDIKQRFGPSLYHPHVIATIAEYNLFIGNTFDALFRQAAKTIKQFASSLQESGRSIMSRVEGDVTVQHLAEVEEDHILQKEYGRAQEHLRNVSNFKKVVDRRRSSSSTAPRMHGMPPEAVPSGVAATSGGSAADIGKGFDAVVEEGKVVATLESIRNFVIAADARSANIFPMRKGNLPLSPAEVEAFKADFRGEKSFRGDFASAITNAVAIYARMLIEADELRQREASAYLWKPHADSLTFLIERSKRLESECAGILSVAEKRGLAEKVKALTHTLQKMEQQSAVVAQMLETVGSVN